MPKRKYQDFGYSDSESNKEEEEEDEEEESSDDDRPDCKYGANCYRKNPAHFEQYRHPASVIARKLKEALSPKRKKTKLTSSSTSKQDTTRIHVDDEDDDNEDDDDNKDDDNQDNDNQDDDNQDDDNDVASKRTIPVGRLSTSTTKKYRPSIAGDVARARAGLSPILSSSSSSSTTTTTTTTTATAAAAAAGNNKKEKKKKQQQQQKKKKKKKKKVLPPCIYGSNCYRKNLLHFAEFSHPIQDSKYSNHDNNNNNNHNNHNDSNVSDDNGSDPMNLDSDLDSDSESNDDEDDSRKTRQNKKIQQSTTKKGKIKKRKPQKIDNNNNDDDDDDADMITDDSIMDDDMVHDGGDGNDCLIPPLVRSYSSMTEAERKKLIEDALAAKERLEQELRKKSVEATRLRQEKRLIEIEKKQSEEKYQREMKEMLNKFTNSSSDSPLLVEGELEARAGYQTVYFPLYAERQFDSNSAEQLHFRLAESQFYRLLGPGCNFRVTLVEYVVSPTLVARFEEAKNKFKKVKIDDNIVLGFHGTAERNIGPICEGGFKTPSDKGFKHATDSGFYGRGVYFSEYPSYSAGYIKGGQKLLLCQLICGRVYRCNKLIHGASLTSGYDSHMSPDGKEVVIFNGSHILPQYIVHYTQAKSDYKYTKTGRTKKITSEQKAMLINDGSRAGAEYAKAVNVVMSDDSSLDLLFADMHFAMSGKLAASHRNLTELIQSCGGVVDTNVRQADVLLCTPKEVARQSKKVEEAFENNVTVLNQRYVYECILKKQLVDNDLYLL